MNTTLNTPAQPTWPIETDLVFVAGTTKVKLSIQHRLIQNVFRDTFENVRCALLFEHAFPDALAIPSVIRKAVLAAAEALKFVNGRHNESASCVHQRLLLDDDYLSKMIRLVSNTTLWVT